MPHSTSKLVVVAVLLAGCGEDAPAGTDGAVQAADPCAACTPSELCVQRFDGTCNATAECVTPTVVCPANACSTECEAAYCPAPYQCANRAPCGGESSASFTCYGP